MAGNDVMLAVGEERLTASRKVLAQYSEYFRAMFDHDFSESRQDCVVLQGLEPKSVKFLLCWVEDPTSSLPSLTTSEALDLLQASGMLQFDSVHSMCSRLLLDRIEIDCFEIMCACDVLGEQELLRKCTNFILCNFSKLGIEAIQGKNQVFNNCDSDTLRKVLENPRLNCDSESQVCDVLHCWAGEQKEKQELVKELMDVWRRVERRLPVFPCVMGQRMSSELLVKGTEGGGWCKRGLATLLVFNPVANTLEEVPWLGEGRHLEPTGFKSVSRDQCVLVCGGEVHLGHSNWNMTVSMCDTLTRRWKEVAKLTVSRRHHAAVVVDNYLYLLGGYGKHRMVLDSMERVSLETGESTRCANLPQPARRPAAAVWKGRLVAVIGGRLLQYNQHMDRWGEMEEPVLLPSGFEVDCAMAYTAKDGGSLYLTSTCSRDLYRVSPSYIMEKVGSFSSEAGNTCMVAGILYNFYSEEFGDCRVVESYNTSTGQFNVLFRKDLPKWDFSPAPQYSYGCFPLLSYEL